jgi:hypothetical protein
MNTTLRKAARQYADAWAFAAAFQRNWNHVAGTGLRELARIWHRANS